MEFCQIQLNYLDWKLQDAKAKVELLNAYHMPVWVMEPLRGGRLAQLSEGKYRKAENASSGGRNSGMGFPLPSERTWCDCGFIRNVEHGADGEKYPHL